MGAFKKLGKWYGKTWKDLGNGFTEKLLPNVIAPLVAAGVAGATGQGGSIISGGLNGIMGGGATGSNALQNVGSNEQGVYRFGAESSTQTDLKLPLVIGGGVLVLIVLIIALRK